MFTSLMPGAGGSTKTPLLGEADPIIGVAAAEPSSGSISWKDVLKRKSVGDIDSLEERATEILHTGNYCFRGCHVTLQNVLSKHFLTLHTLEMGPGADYIFTGYLKSNHWLLNGRMGVSGTKAKVDYENGGFQANFSGNFADDAMKSHFEADVGYTMKDMNVQVKMSDFAAIGLCYTQPITDSIGIGAQVFSVLHNDKALLKLVAQHIDKEAETQTILSCSTGLGPESIALSYHHKIMKNLSFLAHIEATFGSDKQAPGGPKEWSTVFKAGYLYQCREMLQYPMPTLRGCLDSTGNIAVFLEEPMGEMVMMNLAAKANPISDEYDIGIGFTLTL